MIRNPVMPVGRIATSVLHVEPPTSKAACLDLLGIGTVHDFVCLPTGFVSRHTQKKLATNLVFG